MRTDAISIYLDGEAHGHRMTLSAFQETGKADADELLLSSSGRHPQAQQHPQPAPLCSHFRDPGSPRLPRFPDNCTKPIKEDTVPFHAA